MSAFATRFGVRAVLVCQAALGFAVVGSGGSAWANAGVVIHNNNGANVNDFADVSLSRSVNYSDTLADNLVLSSAALDTGTLKVAATYESFTPGYYWLSGTRNSEVLALIQDTVTIGGPGAMAPATVKLQFDGVFNMTGSSGLGEIRISPFLELGGYGALSAGVDRLYNPSGISNGGVAQDQVSSEFVGTPGAGSFLNTSLTFVDGLLVLTTMVPTNQAITLNMQLDLVFDQLTPGVRAAADFSHTATLSIELPQGYTYTSGSGVLLTASAVPEPGAFGLMALGLAALQIRRRQLIR
jgi:hypothetical protein